MALDAYGNYICDISPAAVSPLPTSMFSGNSGVGAPSNADGNDGDTYVDLTTGTFYTKSGGTWAVATGGVGPAGGSGLYGSGSPEGVKTAAPGTTYLDIDNNAFWVKETGVLAIGWIPIVY